MKRESSEQNQIWVDFLNSKEQLENMADEKLDENDFFMLWQRENLHRKIWDSHKDLLLATHEFMYDNLKLISRGKISFIEEKPLFGMEKANIIMQNYNAYYTSKGKKLYMPKSISVPSLFFLFNLLPPFFDYIHKILEGSKLKYTIGICPYQKKKSPKECGFVFIGNYNQKACESHHLLQKSLSNNRRNEGEKYGEKRQ